MNRLPRLIVIAPLLASTAALADEFHYNNALIGDRAAGMGGAYTAVSDDAAGLYYNPAGTAYAKGRSLSVSVNAYNYTNTDYRSALGGTDWTRTSSTLLPNFFGVVRPLGPGVVGFSYAVPDSIEEDQDQTYGGFPSSIPGVNVNEYVINLNNNDKTYLFGPSYAMEINKSLAVGATLYVHYRARETILNQLVQLSNGQDEWTNQYYQTDETGLRPILGIMWSPADKVSLGLTVSTTYILSSTTEVQGTLKPATSGDVVRSVLKTNDERDMPTTIALGAAWFPSESLIYALDVTYNSSTSDNFQKRESTYNVAAGVEYYPTSNWAVRGGVFTNLAATPKIDASQTGQQEHVDLYGVSASVSRFSAGTSLTAGLTYSQGSGDTQLFSGSTTVVPVDRSSFTLFLSASTTY